MTTAELIANLTARFRRALPALTSRRSANVVFTASLVLGFTAMLVINRDSWFYADDFAYLYEGNEAFERGDYVDWLLSPHNEHWAVLPVVIFRGLFALFGMNHYLPYLVPVLVAHIIALVILRILMIRSGVQYWVATGICIALILFGGGAQNLNWAFQIGFVGAVMFGLAQVLSVDHDGPIRARDFLGLVFGLLAISTQGPGIAMVIIATLLLVLRRRFRAAGLQVVPLAAIYLVWYVSFGQGPTVRSGTSVFDLAGIPQYVWQGISEGLDGLTQLSGSAAVLSVVLVATLMYRGGMRRTPLATSLVVGVVAFYCIIGFGRVSLGVEQAGEGRYVYVTGILVALSLGLALSSVKLPGSRQWAPAVLLIGWMLVANPAAYYTATMETAGIRRDTKALVTAIATAPGIRQSDPMARPVPGAPNVTVGTTLQYADQGLLPLNTDPSAAQVATIAVYTLVATTTTPDGPPGAPRYGDTGLIPTESPGCSMLEAPEIAFGEGSIDLVLRNEVAAIAQLRDLATGQESAERKLPLSSGTTRVTNSSVGGVLVLKVPQGTGLVVCGLKNPAS